MELNERLESEKAKMTVGLPDWVLAVPEEYWIYFLQLYQEGISFFFPVPGDWGYWKVTEGREDLELRYKPESEKAAKDYFNKILNRGINFFVTKRDFDDRIRQILSDSA